MLSGENSSYAMAVCKLGYLHHIYYGDRLEESSIPCLPENSALG